MPQTPFVIIHPNRKDISSKKGLNGLTVHYLEFQDMVYTTPYFFTFSFPLDVFTLETDHASD